MLYKKQLCFFVLMCAVLLFVVGCSEDEESPVKPTPKTEPPEFQLRDITFPDKMKNSTDEKAQLAMTVIQGAMSFEGTGCIFAPPSGAEVLAETQTAWEYSWQEGNLTKRLAITSLTSINQRKWQIYYTGSADGITYEDNWRFMDAGQTTDLGGGHVYVYKPNTKQIINEWTWRTESGKYTFETYDYSTPKLNIEIIINSNKSGKVERFVPSATGVMMHDLLISWDKNGNGSWWTYESGVTTGSGTWE